MRKYNDYVLAVIRYLSHNSELKTYLTSLEADRDSKAEMLKTIMHPITAQYSLTAGCGAGDNSSKVELEAERRDKIRQELITINLNIAEIRSNLNRVSLAFEQLDRDSQVILRGRFMSRCKASWEYISSQVHCNIKTCRRKQDDALKSMAIAMFGAKVAPEQLSFVFLPPVVDNFAV